jgi:phenylalanyl-tRNA synthetase alpha chain
LSTQTPFHPLEKKALSILLKHKTMELGDLAKESGESIDQVRRVTEWLRTKGYVAVETKSRVLLAAGPEGAFVARSGLPETRLARAVHSRGSAVPLESLARELQMQRSAFNAAVGRARGLGWIEIRKSDAGLLAVPLSVPAPLPAEDLLRKLAESPVDSSLLSSEEKALVGLLSKRPGYIIEREEKVVGVRLVKRPDAAQLEAGEEVVLTSSILQKVASGEVKLSTLDVSSPVPIRMIGKEHPMATFLRSVRETLLSMGFEEVDGPLVQSSFWTFDALFTPQDHPAREMQDTYYLENVKSSVTDQALVDRIKQVHENGWNLGSRGWRYKWSLEEAERSVLRTHTTAITIRYLADHSSELAKVFSLGKVFRNENLDATHLNEFNQIEGIVVEKDGSLRRLMGYLSAFLKGLGFKKVMFQPSYFPYTEPSMEPQVYSEKLGKWLELGGSGVFRPEVTLPMGVKNPVMAWGFGLERLALLYFDANDIRELYSNRLSWVREVPQCP